MRFCDPRLNLASSNIGPKLSKFLRFSVDTPTTTWGSCFKVWPCGRCAILSPNLCLVSSILGPSSVWWLHNFNLSTVQFKDVLLKSKKWCYKKWIFTPVLNQNYCCDILCSLRLCYVLLEYILTEILGLESSNGPKQIQSHFYTLACPPLKGKHHFYFVPPLLWAQWKEKQKGPWRAPSGPKVHLSLQHTGQTATAWLNSTHLPMFIHCRPLSQNIMVL